MEDLDLDINNYELKDLLNLFKLKENFNEKDLKQAKQIVLMTHPDKSKLDAKYFLFYSKAYKSLYSIYNFKNKSEKSFKNDTYETICKDEKNETLNSFFEKSPELKKPDNFNKWFNEQFEKNKIKTEEESQGYGDWLKSDEDIEPENNISQSQMGIEFEKKKRDLRALVVNKEVNDIYYTPSNMTISNITGDVPEEFSSCLFSNLQYQDLRKAHKESIIPVSEDDYNNITKYKDVNELKNYRNNQNIKPMTEEESFIYLNNKNEQLDIDSTERAFKLTKQLEEVKNKEKSFWSNLLKIGN